MNGTKHFIELAEIPIIVTRCDTAAGTSVIDGVGLPWKRKMDRSVIDQLLEADYWFWLPRARIGVSHDVMG